MEDEQATHVRQEPSLAPSDSDTTINSNTDPFISYYGQHEDDLHEASTGCHQEPDLIWTPETINGLDKEQLELYFNFAASPCIPGGGCNVEQALDVLQQASGDIQEAMQRLLKSTLNDNLIWTLGEVQLFERLQMLHGKNFYLISQDLKTKTVKECIQFFYIWKKSTFRNRYISPTTPKSMGGSLTSITSSSSSSATTLSTSTNNSSYNLSHTQIPPTATNLSASQSNLTGTPSSSTSDESRDSGRGESMLGIEDQKQYLLTPAIVKPEEVFPCKVCGRIFEKIKSRSAHMKRHKNEGYRR